MARQAVVVVALSLLATLAFAADEQPEVCNPPFNPVPTSIPVIPTTDSNAVRTPDSPPAAGRPSDFYDAIAAGVGAPVSEKTFGTAKPPKSGGATIHQVLAVAALAAVAVASFEF